jgi:hypothetical protein
MLGAEDFNGFNSGNLLYRCGLDLIAFLSRTIVKSDDMIRAYSYDKVDPVGIESPPSDQRAICLTLQDHPTYANRFYHYPEHWLNAYPSKLVPMQLNTHMVASNKYQTDLEQFTESERLTMEHIRSMTPEDVKSEEERVGNSAREHWKTAKVGAPKCFWV